MTTAAQLLSGYGITMDQARAWLVQHVGNPADVLVLCQQAHITNAMLGEIAGWPGSPVPGNLVLSYFALHGLNSGVLELAPTVSTVSNSSVTEGGVLEFNVALSGVTSVQTAYHLSAAFTTASLGDLSSYTITNGVTFNGTDLQVPSGVSSFTLKLGTANDSFVESNETMMVTIGGVTAVGTIVDNDTPVPQAQPLIPADLMELASLVSLDTFSGDLSTASLRAHIIPNTNAADYNALFSVGGILGADDGTWTAADLGFGQLGDLPATQETLESLFYGTIIKTLKSIDVQEAFEIQAFVSSHEVQIIAEDPAVIGAYVDLLVSVFSDPAVFQAIPDAQIATTIVAVGTAMVQTAAGGADVDIFASLLNLF